jgi:hypothetical protein
MQGDPPQAPGTVRAIFAEGPRQVAVVAGSVYYARDRVPGRLAAPARVAFFEERAASSGREHLPRYESGEAPMVVRAMEPLLARFLSPPPEPEPDANTTPVPLQ